MALVLEDGTGLPNSNSYADVAYADAYFAGHPYYAEAWDDLTSPQKENLLIAASYYIDSEFEWHGYRVSETQAMDWPRQWIVNPDPVGTLYYFPTGVPDRVRRATCEQARFMSLGDATVSSSGGDGISELKIDVIELKFDSSVRVMTSNSMVLSLLRDLGIWSGAARVRKVLVG